MLPRSAEMTLRKSFTYQRALLPRLGVDAVIGAWGDRKDVNTIGEASKAHEDAAAKMSSV
jgi:hypothetical protein